MLSLLKKTVYALLILLMLALVLELGLGVVFCVKDKKAAVEDVTDAPYLYYQYNAGPQTNADGFKTNAPRQKPEGTYRIILTGGSVARGKAPKESIARYLQDTLRARLHRNDIEVINAGVSGYVLQQEFLLTQLVLQYYQPDMIIGLDGYNDALTLALNPDWSGATPFKPHNWQDFQVIKENRWKAKPYSRFAYFFKNINRAKESWLRSRRLESVDWATRVQRDTLLALTDDYYRVATDLHQLCDSKGITYLQLIQPVYASRVTDRFGTGSGAFMLSYLNQLSRHADNLPYAYSLTSLFANHKDLFYDDVHVVAEGNQRFAGAIAEVISSQLTVDSLESTVDSPQTTVDSLSIP